MWRERSGHSGKLVVEVDYLPDDKDYIVNMVSPPCPGESCPSVDGRLCDACWFEDFVNTVGFESIVEWEEKESTLRITGHMQFELVNSIDYGRNYDEWFEVENVEVLS
jgi:hypothetical protein